MDSDIKSILQDIQERLKALELKSTSTVSNNTSNVASNENDQQPTAGAGLQGDHIDDGGSADNFQEVSASNRPIHDVLKEFEQIKESLARVSLPAHLKVQDSAAGIKQDSRATLKILSKSARFAETTLKQISILSARQQDDKSYIISEEELSILFAISAAQIHFLQSEYAGLVVKNTFDEETSRLFKSFENHASAFNTSSLQNLRVAADLASARDRALQRGNYRVSLRNPRSFRQSYRGRGFHNFTADWQFARRPPSDRPPDDM